MSLYDIVGSIAESEREKTGGGQVKIMGPVVGIVAKKYSKDMPGRVCVQIPVRDGDANVLQWAKTVMTSAGKKWGNYFLPEIGDKVLLVFENGNIEKPYIVGSIFADDSEFLQNVADEENQYKKIKTKNGNALLFVDSREGEGSKDRIELETSKGEHIIILDNENKKITLRDKQGENSINMNTEKGEIEIKVKNRMKISGGNVSVVIDGDSGKISISCEKLSLKANQGITAETGGMFKMKGESTNVSGSSSVKLSSDGTTIIQGAVIKEG